MSVITFTDNSFGEDVLKSPVPVVVDFWAPWCGPCQMVTPTIDAIAEEYGEKVKVGKMNVDENSQVPSQFGIMSIPTVVVFKNGEPQKTLVGAQSKETYKQAI